jgi:HEAT repeat protein
MSCTRLSVIAFFCCAALFSLAAQAADSGPPEPELIATLETSTDWQARYEACYNLRRMGTAASVPALSKLLNDEHLSHMARYALESMDAPEAGAALRDALGAVDAPRKAGIASSLGVRRDTEAVGALTALTQDADAAVAESAIAALGRIGGPEAIGALLNGGAAGAHRMAYGNALLDAGTNSPGKHWDLFKDLMSETWPEPVRLGAFRALAVAAPDHSPKLIGEVLSGSDVRMRDFAAQLVAEVPGNGLTRKYAALLANQPSDGAITLLRGLADRGDAQARKAVLELAKTGAPDVQLAALQTLSSIGTAADVPMLTTRIGGEAADQAEYARKSLAALRTNGVDEAIVKASKKAAPATRAALLEVLAERGSSLALPTALEALSAEDSVVRVAAFGTVSQLGTASEAEATIAALASDDEATREAASKALGRICVREQAAALPPVQTALASAEPATAAVLVRNLGRIGSAEALAALLPQVASAQPDVADAALQTLSEWPGREARPHLLALAKTDGPARESALKGFVRLARAETDAPAKIAALQEAAALAKTKQDRWQIIAAWGTLPDPAALTALSGDLGDAEVGNEAASALINIAPELAKRDEESKKQVAAALETVVNTAESQAVRDRAAKTLADLG